jgi:hypothetical protein
LVFIRADDEGGGPKISFTSCAVRRELRKNKKPSLMEPPQSQGGGGFLMQRQYGDRWFGDWTGVDF